MLDWYHFYLNHPVVSILVKTIIELCYWKGFVVKADMYAKLCKIYQQFKNRKTLYGNLPRKNIAELITWDLVNAYLVGPYS